MRNLSLVISPVYIRAILGNKKTQLRLIKDRPIEYRAGDNICVEELNNGWCVARVRLHVYKVRQQSLQTMTEHEVIAEGFDNLHKFRRMWDSIYNRHDMGWDTNPIVQVLEFDKESLGDK